MKDEGPDVVGEIIEVIVRLGCAWAGVAEYYGLAIAALILIVILGLEMRRLRVKKRLRANSQRPERGKGGVGVGPAHGRKAGNNQPTLRSA